MTEDVKRYQVASTDEPAGAIPSELPSTWVTDPKAVGIDATAIANNASGYWEPAHHHLLTLLRLEYQKLVNLLLNPISQEIGQPLNGWQFKRAKGPQEVTRNAENELKELQHRVARMHKSPLELPSPRDADPPSGIDWLKLVAILVSCIVLEAIANVSLLSRALETGLVGAFITAILISVINVGALGCGGGLILSAAYRKLQSHVPFYAGCGVLGVLAIGLNFIVGRHREAFAIIIEQRAQQALEATDVSMATATEVAAGVSFNPVSWELESLLFLVLGLALFGVGFYKGFAFIKAGLRRRDAEQSMVLEQKQVKDRYADLSERYREKLTRELRVEVAGWIEKLDRERRSARNTLEDVKENWDKGSYLDFVETEFIVAHNKCSPNKIDRENLAANREKGGFDWTFPATQADWEVLDEADRIVTNWQESEQEAFFENIHQECERIDDLWQRYESVILGSRTESESQDDTR